MNVDRLIEFLVNSGFQLKKFGRGYRTYTIVSQGITYYVNLRWVCDTAKHPESFEWCTLEGPSINLRTGRSTKRGLLAKWNTVQGATGGIMRKINQTNLELIDKLPKLRR